LGVRNPTPKLQSLLSQERLKLGTSNLAEIFTGSIRTQAYEKFCEKRERGRIQGRPKFFLSTPYYLRNGQSYELQIWQVYSWGPSKQNPLKNLREKGAWAYPGTFQFFEYLLLSQE